MRHSHLQPRPLALLSPRRVFLAFSSSNLQHLYPGLISEQWNECLLGYPVYEQTRNFAAGEVAKFLGRCRKVSTHSPVDGQRKTRRFHGSYCHMRFPILNSLVGDDVWVTMTTYRASENLQMVVLAEAVQVGRVRMPAAFMRERCSRHQPALGGWLASSHVEHQGSVPTSALL